MTVITTEHVNRIRVLSRSVKKKSVMCAIMCRDKSSHTAHLPVSAFETMKKSIKKKAPHINIEE